MFERTARQTGPAGGGGGGLLKIQQTEEQTTQQTETLIGHKAS